MAKASKSKSAGRLLLPTDQMKKADRLCRTQGLNDAQIGRVLGCSREWACKLRAEHRRRADRLLALSADRGDSSLLAGLLN